MMRNSWTDPRFLTLGQAKTYAEEQGYDPKKVRIKKGSKASYILQPIVYTKKNKDKDNQQPSKPDILDRVMGADSSNGTPESQNQNPSEQERTFLRFKTVPRFNAEQFTGFPKLEDLLGERTWTHNALVDHLVAVNKIEVKQGSESVYRPNQDNIEMPPANAFEEESQYTSTLLHELYHWTGHKSRENRGIETITPVEYAKEEIRAQMFMLSASALLEIPVQVEQEADYVQSFKEGGKLDYKAVYKEFKAASKMFTEVLVPFVAEEQPTVSWFPDKSTWPARSDAAVQEAKDSALQNDNFDPFEMARDLPKNDTSKGADAFALAEDIPANNSSAGDIFDLAYDSPVNDTEDFFMSPR